MYSSTVLDLSKFLTYVRYIWAIRVRGRYLQLCRKDRYPSVIARSIFCGSTWYEYQIVRSLKFLPSLVRRDR
jgi:hypothetical protein